MNPGGRHWAVVPAAGVGRRMKADRPKQYLSLTDGWVIDHTLNTLLSHPAIEGVVLALSAYDPYWPQSRFATDTRIKTVEGGKERVYSVYNALKYLTQHLHAQDWVLVHDAARPCLRHDDLDQLIEAAHASSQGALLALPVHDTIKQADSASQCWQTLDRNRIWRALTPQMFQLEPLLTAIDAALSRNLTITDEASAIEAQGGRPRLVAGHEDNLKITRPADLPLAAFFLAQQRAES
jgi:2-C-methyl-D-erythritol 4-phosphate cytidylyltransferase